MGRRVSVRLGQPLYEQLQAAAAAQGVDLSAVVRQILAAAFHLSSQGADASAPPPPTARAGHPRLREAIVPWAEYRRHALQDPEGCLPMPHAAVAPGAAQPASTADLPSSG